EREIAFEGIAIERVEQAGASVDRVDRRIFVAAPWCRGKYMPAVGNGHGFDLDGRFGRDHRERFRRAARGMGGIRGFGLGERAGVSRDKGGEGIRRDRTFGGAIGESGLWGGSDDWGFLFARKAANRLAHLRSSALWLPPLACELGALSGKG